MPDQTDMAERFQGYELVDAQGQTLGAIHSLWLDTATKQPEFVAVKTGALMGRTHIVPVAGAQVDETNRQLRVPYNRDQIDSAPHVDESAELSEQEEEQVYRHYGVQRSEAPSPTGLAGGGVGARGQAEQRHTQTTSGAAMGEGGRRRERIQLREERPRIETEQEQAGEVRLGTRVTERQETVEVPVREERVVIERTPMQGEPARGEITGQGETIDVPVTRERPVVEKETVVAEEVNVHKETTERQEPVQTTLRKEELAVEGEGNAVADSARAARTTEADRERRRS